MASPRIALCAFNPHASDGGLFGDEEERIYEPALAILHGAGLDVTGPVPADTVFLRAARGEFDAVIAPYHDVGMAAFKTAAFGSGVNVTLGLPFPRTSPDHGTALDIAGLGIADASSMIEALALAARLAGRDLTRSSAVAS
jgi:4-hydroxy-L-threonine phosphate dehydrogenase PdxA